MENIIYEMKEQRNKGEKEPLPSQHFFQISGFKPRTTISPWLLNKHSI